MGRGFVRRLRVDKPPRPCRKCRQRVWRGGLCASHYRQQDLRRGSAAARGYGSGHRVFRESVLVRDPVCVCGEPSSVADHYPLTRRQLVVLGLDPNDPQHGRGLCERCHNSHTAQSTIARRD